MHLKTILNRVTNYKSFVFGKITWQEDALTPAVDVEVQPRSNGRPVCSGCGKRRPGYDTMPTPRRFDFIPLWGIAVVFVYSMRRVDCPACGVKVERVPWAEGKSTMTVEYAWYLAKWARRMSWKEVSEALRVSWDRVFAAVKQAVNWGLARGIWNPLLRSAWMKFSGIGGTTTKRWCIRSMKTRNGCCGSAPTERQRPCCGSSAFWARSGRHGSSLSAVTCGKRT